MLLYVDDIIMTSDDQDLINQLQTRMMTTFKMTNLGDAKYYLGIQLELTLEDIYFHQQRYIKKLLDEFGMSDCIPISIPMHPRTKLLRHELGTCRSKIQTRTKGLSKVYFMQPSTIGTYSLQPTTFRVT